MNEPTTQTRELTVQNKMGIHARPAAMIVRIANKFPAVSLDVVKDDEQVNGKSIMGLMMLAAGSGWYNVRIYYNEKFYENNTDYYTVLYPDVKNANGVALSVGDTFTSADRKVTVQTWGNYNLLSLSVEEYSPAEATVEITSVKFEDGMFVVSGTAQNLQGALDIYLINTNVAGSLNIL